MALFPIGLKYQDLLIEREDVTKALGRIDHSVLVERWRKIRKLGSCDDLIKLIPR